MLNNNQHAQLEAGKAKSKSTGQIQDRPSVAVSKTRLATLAQIGEDWLYLALLGIIMALLSFSMDSIITLFLGTRLWLFKDLSADSLIIQ